MRIDCQTHIFPVEYAEVLTQNPEWPRTVLEADQFLLTYVCHEARGTRRQEKPQSKRHS
jgi:hypothetical protein